jgi:hypothetical protein
MCQLTKKEKHHTFIRKSDKPRRSFAITRDQRMEKLLTTLSLENPALFFAITFQ